MNKGWGKGRKTLGRYGQALPAGGGKGAGKGKAGTDGEGRIPLVRQSIQRPKQAKIRPENLRHRAAAVIPEGTAQVEYTGQLVIRIQSI